jgi:hypothetical protein
MLGVFEKKIWRGENYLTLRRNSLGAMPRSCRKALEK